MILHEVNCSLLRRALMKKYLLNSYRKYNRKIDTVSKRGSMLENLITNKDKRKNWHLNIFSDAPKARLFDKVHMPHRRHRVLNSLFIKNITDVLSTGDIAPEISNFGFEITAVRISPCFKLLNVYWQVPSSQEDSCEDIGKILTRAAPSIRAELISRNVLGRVPFLFFLRDGTNQKVSTFEKAMEKLELEPASDPAIIVDDSFIKDIFSFKKTEVGKKNKDILDVDTKDYCSSNTNNVKEESPEPPEPSVNTPDMKCDVFGLNHKLMMEKVMALRKRKKPPNTKTALISVESLKDADLFDKIPGVCFEPDNNSSSRNEILKQFQIERRILKQQKKKGTLCHDNQHFINGDSSDLIDEAESNLYEEDFFDDNVTENPRH